MEIHRFVDALSRPDGWSPDHGVYSDISRSDIELFKPTGGSGAASFARADALLLAGRGPVSFSMSTSLGLRALGLGLDLANILFWAESHVLSYVLLLLHAHSCTVLRGIVRLL